MKTFLGALLRDEGGRELSEYVLLASLMVLSYLMVRWWVVGVVGSALDSVGSTLVSTLR